MRDLFINCTVYNQGNVDSSLEELRFKDWTQSGKKKIDQNDQDQKLDEYEFALTELIDTVTKKIRLNVNVYGVYEGTLLKTENGFEYIRHCLSIPDLKNLSIEEFRYITIKKLSKSNASSYLLQIAANPSTLNLNNLVLLPRTGTSTPPSIQVFWKSF